MEIKRDKAFELLKDYCGGNYNRFARELGVNPSHLYRFLHSGIGGGKKVLGAIMKFCNDKGLDFEDYIAL